MVVFPAASKPTMRIRISLLPPEAVKQFTERETHGGDFEVTTWTGSGLGETGGSSTRTLICATRSVSGRVLSGVLTLSLSIDFGTEARQPRQPQCQAAVCFIAMGAAGEDRKRGQIWRATAQWARPLRAVSRLPEYGPVTDEGTGGTRQNVEAQRRGPAAEGRVGRTRALRGGGRDMDSPSLRFSAGAAVGDAVGGTSASMGLSV